MMMRNALAKLVVVLTALTMLAATAAYSTDQPSETPVELVRRTVKNETASGTNNTKAMYLDRKETAHGSQTKLVVETREGTAGMTILIDGKALSPEQRQAEEARLSELAKDPDELKKRQRSDKEDDERTARIMRALPDAFLYEPDGTVAGTPKIGKPGDQLVRLKFRPNPNYNPPTHVEQILTGLEGYLLIDADQHRIAKIDGVLGKDVGFGWGILGRLDRGGHFLVEQADVIKGEWELTRMSLGFTGKELLFKNINIKSDEVFSEFRLAPSNLTFAQGVELLKKQADLPITAQNHNPQ
jgi:hypothetical protein